MLVLEQEYRTSITQVARGAINLLVLYLGTALVPKLPGMTTSIGGIRLRSWVEMAIALAATAIVVRIVSPTRSVVSVLIVSLLRLATLKEGSSYEFHATQASSRVVSLIALIACFAFLDAPLLAISAALLGGPQLYNVIMWTAAAVGIGLAIGIWRSLDPLLTLVSTQVGEAAAGATVARLFVDCPSCRTSNDKAALFCARCGARLIEGAAETKETGGTGRQEV